MYNTVVSYLEASLKDVCLLPALWFPSGSAASSQHCCFLPALPILVCNVVAPWHCCFLITLLFFSSYCRFSPALLFPLPISDNTAPMKYISKRTYTHPLCVFLFPQIPDRAIQPRHCVLAHTDGGIITVTPNSQEAETYVNNMRIYETTILKNGMTVAFGRNNLFRFVHPNEHEVRSLQAIVYILFIRNCHSMSISRKNS